MFQTVISTPLGWMVAKANDNAITALQFTDSCEIEIHENKWLLQLKVELNEYFNLSRKDFSLPLAPVGTDFQKSVWNELHKIPYGVTRSYKEQSHVMNKPDAIRAIAAANGRNPIVILIPCHRVVGSNGSMTGYSGGISKKIELLQLEMNNSSEAFFNAKRYSQQLF